MDNKTAKKLIREKANEMRDAEYKISPEFFVDTDLSLGVKTGLYTIENAAEEYINRFEKACIVNV